MELSFLDSFLSPLKSCKSPRPSHVGRSPRFSPAQLLSPAQSTQSLSPAQGFNSLAHAFEQVGLLIVMYTYALQPHFQNGVCKSSIGVATFFGVSVCRAFDGTPSPGQYSQSIKSDSDLSCRATRSHCPQWTWRPRGADTSLLHQQTSLPRAVPDPLLSGAITITT